MAQRGAGEWRRNGKPRPLFPAAVPDLPDEADEPDYLPAVRPTTDPAPPEGTVVQRERTVRPTVVVGKAVHVITDVATHRRTRTAARHLAYVALGAHVTAKKMWRSRSTATYTEQMEAAKARGDTDRWLEVEARKSAFQSARHARRMDWFELPGKAIVGLRNLAIIAAIVLSVLAAAGWAATGDPTQVRSPFIWAAKVIWFVLIIIGVTWAWILAFGSATAVLVLWNVGRSRAEVPAYLLPPDQRRRDEHDNPITPSRVVVAFRDLGIPALRKAIQDMGDLGAAMLSPIKVAGCGVEVDVSLPSGVTTEEIQQRRRKLAENLGRHEHEVFITIPEAARTVRLWIADSGALDEPIGASPLVYDTELVADYYTGRAPWGQDLRGEAADISLYQRHVLITGKSNQGKTAALRALALWLALYPFLEFRIGDLKGVGDWRMFDGIATKLIQGPTDEHVMAVTHMVEGVVQEMNRRLTALEQSGATDGVTRDMAQAGIGFHPLVCLVDEAQVAFMCPAKGEDGRPYGGKKATSRYFMAVRQIHNQGRAVNVTMWQGTQDPTDENLPKLVREGAHIRGSLHLGTEAQARMALGEGPVDAGAAPHKLRDGLDKGMLVVAGDGVKIPAGQPSITIRTFFVSGADAARVAERAKKRRAPIATGAIDAAEEEQRDLLDDLSEVIGEEKQKLTDLVSLLRRHFPRWAPYERLTGRALGRALDDAEVRTTNTDNLPRLDPADLRKAIARRATEDRSDPDE